MDLDQANEILKEGYPTYDTLGEFPLGEELQKLDLLAWTLTARPISLRIDEPGLPKKELGDKLKKEGRMLADERLGEIYRQHISHVMNCLNHLLGRNLGRILPDLTPADWAESPFVEYNAFLKGLGDYTIKFLRFVTLYHDVGKIVHRDRHPMLGQHLLQSLSDDHTRKFRRILTQSFTMMDQLVAHHDLFGVLCTGEASRPVLVDAFRLKDSDKTIDYLVTLNLADIYGALFGMTKNIMTTVLNDWLFVQGLIQKQRPIGGIIYKSNLEKQIIDQAQEQESSIERLRRLLVTVIYMLSNVSKGDKDALAGSVTNDFVLDAMKNRLGPELPVFCRDFALVCKLDYTLRFFVDLFSAWVKIEKEKQTSGGGRASDNVVSIADSDMRGIAAISVEILVRLVTNYRDLTQQREGGRRRIGIELLGLTRSQGISESVIGLLLSDRHTEGVNWVADEATAWYFI